MEPLISIIIPFHNEETFLYRAVASAIKQSYSNIEIILVNDASTDHSFHIAENLKVNHPNIQIITINNRSLGAARNVGISASQGQYISFLDADDVLLPNAISDLYSNITQQQSDVSIGKFNIMGDHNLSQKAIGWKLDGALKSGMEAALGMYEFQIVYTVWAKLFKTGIVKQIPFEETFWFEDRSFMLRYFLQSKSVSFLDKEVLQFESRPDSISRRLISTKRITDIFEVYRLELLAIKHHSEESALKRAIDRHEINAFIENLIFLYLDKDKVKHSEELMHCFDQQSKAFIDQLKINKSPLGKRDWLDILLLRLHSIIGWNNTFNILPILKQKKCKAIASLRASKS